MTRRLLATCVMIAACKTSTEAKSEAHADLSVEKHLSEVAVTTQTVQTGPETITTTVEEFAIADPHAAGTEPGDGSFEPTKPPDPRGTNGTAGPTGQSQLVKRTVTVDQRAPATSETTLNEHTSTETHSEAKVDQRASLVKESSPAGLFGSLAGLWPLALLALLCGAAWIGWHLLKSRLP